MKIGDIIQHKIMISFRYHLCHTTCGCSGDDKFYEKIVFKDRNKIKTIKLCGQPVQNLEYFEYIKNYKLIRSV